MPATPAIKLSALLFYCCGAFLLGACNRGFVPQGPIFLAANQQAGDGAGIVQWLGVSSWIISRGNDVVVVDPFFSRPSFLSVGSSLVLSALSGKFFYDSERIEDVLPDLPANTRFVLLGHAHYDHLMDVPYYLARPSGMNVTYVGSETARNILLGFKPAQLKFDVVSKEGKEIRQGKIRVTAMASDHAPHLTGIKIMGGEVASPRDLPPTKVGEYREGQTFSLFYRFSRRPKPNYLASVR